MESTRNLKVGMQMSAVAFSLGIISPVVQASADLVSHEPEQAYLNETSFASMESSWLEVPGPCKAKGFNADPRPVTEAPMPSAVAAIFGV